MSAPVGLRLRSRFLACALLAAALTLLGSSSLGSSSRAAAAGELRIRMFGDSVMLGARDDLVAALPGTDTYVDAVESRSLLGTTPVLVAHPDLLGEVVVLDLGYNDMADAGVFRERIDAMMQALAGVPRVVWLTQALFQPGRDAMNDELRAAGERFPNLDVVDWDVQVAAHPEYVYADGLHLTTAGRAAFAAAVKDRIDAYREASAPPASVQGTTVTRVPATVATGDGAASGAERRAAADAGSPAEGPTGRTVGAVAVGLAALVVIAGIVLLRLRRRDGFTAEDDGSRTGGPPRDQRRRHRPVPAHRSHSGAPPVA